MVMAKERECRDDSLVLLSSENAMTFFNLNVSFLMVIKAVSVVISLTRREFAHQRRLEE